MKNRTKLLLLVVSFITLYSTQVLASDPFGLSNLIPQGITNFFTNLNYWLMDLWNALKYVILILLLIVDLILNVGLFYLLYTVYPIYVKNRDTIRGITGRFILNG